MEDVAIEIKKRFQSQTKPAVSSSRLIKVESNIHHDDHDEHELQRDNKRLKELVVKLQYEINENFKKQSDQRMRELYDENQNHQRKIADLIDQLKRKEQEILLIPVGKVAEGKINALEAEK